MPMPVVVALTIVVFVFLLGSYFLIHYYAAPQVAEVDPGSSQSITGQRILKITPALEKKLVMKPDQRILKITPALEKKLISKLN